MSERERKCEEFLKAISEHNVVGVSDIWERGFKAGFKYSWQAAIQAERERCAKIAEERIQCNDLCEQCETAKSIAAAIRRGGEHEH